MKTPATNSLARHIFFCLFVAYLVPVEEKKYEFIIPDKKISAMKIVTIPLTLLSLHEIHHEYNNPIQLDDGIVQLIAYLVQ